MFVDYLTNSHILELLSEFLFCLMKVLEWQSWLSGSKTLFPALVSTQLFSNSWQILDVAEGRLPCLSSWASLLKSDQLTACRLRYLMFILRKIVIGTFNNFVNMVVLISNQSKGKGTRTSFLTNGGEQIALNFFPREPKNMHLLSLVCICKPLFATCISDFSNLPFWSGDMGYIQLVASILSLVFGPLPSSLFFTRNKFLTNSPFDGWTFLIAPFFNLYFTSSFTNSSPFWLTIGWEGTFDWKGFEWSGILHRFTMSKILRSCVIFIQASTKCFNLPVNGTTEILFDKNDLFINW